MEPVFAALHQAGSDSVQHLFGPLGLLRRIADFQPDPILVATASPSSLRALIPIGATNWCTALQAGAS